MVNILERGKDNLRLKLSTIQRQELESAKGKQQVSNLARL